MYRQGYRHGGKPTTCTTVNFWLHPEVIVRPFDIVRIEHIARTGSKNSLSYAIVRDLSYITDSVGHLANYVSSDFGNTDVTPMNERLGTTIAEADVLSNSQNIEMPIRDGARVEWAGQDEIRAALGVDKLKVPISAGYIETSNGEEICIDFEARYLIGPEAAHLNISGISGLASKTSYAMFLLSSLQQRLAEGLSIILFNVKGPDLLAIDQVNTELSEGEKREWEKCGLVPEPLRNVTYLYPYSKKLAKYTSSYLPKDLLERQILEGRAFIIIMMSKPSREGRKALKKRFRGTRYLYFFQTSMIPIPPWKAAYTLSARFKLRTGRASAKKSGVKLERGNRATGRSQFSLGES